MAVMDGGERVVWDMFDSRAPSNNDKEADEQEAAIIGVA